MLALAALPCHVWAVRLSLYASRTRGGLPVVALFYGALAIAALGWVASGPARKQQREAAYFRDNPGEISVHHVDDGLDLRDVGGRWHASLADCPAARGTSDVRSWRSGVVEVFSTSGELVMRVYAAGHRVECLPAR